MLRFAAITILITTLLAAVLVPLDPWLWRTCTVTHPDAFKSTDIHHIFRQAGHLLTWFLIATGFILALYLPAKGAIPPRGQLTARLMIFIAPLVSGGLAEILKRLVGRERPGTHDSSGLYSFKPFLGAFTDGSNMGLPSSHAAVAFGGAFMLLRLFPGAGVIAILWACGCAATRILLGAHYFSDCIVAACLGFLASGLCDFVLKRSNLR